jgi:periplasmic divalent cation tolerance protein
LFQQQTKKGEETLKANLVYITASSEKEALDIGKTLVSERLAASVNIINPVRSLYWWEGKIQDEQEVVIVAKTGSGLVEKLTERVISMHSYICPCVVSIPIEKGNPAFLDWIEEVTRQ